MYPTKFHYFSFTCFMLIHIDVKQLRAHQPLIFVNNSSSTKSNSILLSFIFCLLCSVYLSVCISIAYAVPNVCARLPYDQTVVCVHMSANRSYLPLTLCSNMIFISSRLLPSYYTNSIPRIYVYCIYTLHRHIHTNTHIHNIYNLLLPLRHRISHLHSVFYTFPNNIKEIFKVYFLHELQTPRIAFEYFAFG